VSDTGSGPGVKAHAACPGWEERTLFPLFPSGIAPQTGSACL